MAENGREAGNWLNAYMEYTKECESPDNFHIWCALSDLAAVVRRNVVLDQGNYVLFPNLYVALVGPPARTAKSTAIRMGRQLITQVPGIVIGPDACSREQLIRAMSTSKLDNKCCMTIHSTEFSSIIDTSGILMIQFLTDIYDCDYNNPRGWRYETKTQGKDEIINPFLNMLVGTTPSYIAESMPDSIIGHGFTSRTIFVHEDKERFENPRPKAPDPALVEALVRDLTRIANMHGVFQWDKSGQDAYDAFYHDLYRKIPEDHRLEGYHFRKKIHVLKTAMLLSMAERDELLLDKVMIETAAKLLDAIEPQMARTFSAVGKYDKAIDLERIGSQIVAAGGMWVSDLYKRNYFVGNEQDISLIISTLHRMGNFKLVQKDGKEWIEVISSQLPWSK